LLAQVTASRLSKRDANLAKKGKPAQVMSQIFALFFLQAQGGSGSFLFSLLPMLMIFVLFYFLILGRNASGNSRRSSCSRP